jgi:hypothetical protein
VATRVSEEIFMTNVGGGKVKLSPCLTKSHAMKTYGHGSTAPCILYVGGRGRCMVRLTPRPLYPRGKNTRCPLGRKLGGSQSRS